MPLAAPRPGLLRDPLLERDYLRVCSRPAAFRNRALAAAAVAALVLIVHAASGRWEAQDVVGRRIHLWFASSAAVVTFAISLAEAAAAIPAERSARTLVLLLASPLAPRRMALGFLASRVLFALTVLAGLLPIEGVALLLGGVSGKDVLLAAAALGTAAVWGGAAGMLGGMGAPDSRRGLGRGAGLAACWIMLLPLLLWLLGALWHSHPPGRADPRIGESIARAGGAILYTTPAGAILDLHPYGITAALGFEPWVGQAVPAAAALLTAAVAVLAAGRRLAREDDAEVAASGRGTGGARAFRSPGAHPLAWKEMRPLRNAWARWGLRISVLAWTGLLCWLWIDADMRKDGGPTQSSVGFYDFVVSVPLWFLLLSAATASATLLAEEREKGSLEVLRTTPLSPAAYVLARPAAMLRRNLPMGAVTAAFAAAGIAMGIVSLRGIASWVAGFALAGPFLVLLAFAAGSRAPTVRAAALSTFGIALFLVIGWPLTVVILGWISDWEWLAYLLLLDPLFSLCSPFALHADLPGQPLSDSAVRRHFVACAGTLLWAGAAAWLWVLRDRILDRAFHGRDG